MKFLVVFFAVVALAFAFPDGHEGGEGGGHGGGDHATEVKHGHPVKTAIFHHPGHGFFHNYAPKIEGHLKHRGQGPHIFHHEEGHH